ncbi:unnamed protein product [Auanema sp. JU1783]|nr:unnamed protein product [Auanema sp. JU1783]
MSLRIILAIAFVATAAQAFGFKRGPPPCGLPPFLDDLPEEMQSKLKDIWADYKEGDKCYEQQGQTRDLMESLTKEQRKSLFKRGPPLPPFLRKASKDIQEQFRTVFKDRSIKFEDKPSKLKELAEKILTGDLLEEFNKFHQKMEEDRANYNAKVEKLSKEAREAYDKIEKLDQEKREIYSSVSEDARSELFELHRERYGHHFGGRGGRGFRHRHH